MSESSRMESSSLGLSAARSVNQVCDAFEEAWRAGRRPAIEAFLQDAPEPHRFALLRELIYLDVEYRRRAGETPQVADYHPRFPNLSPTWLARRLAGPSASPPLNPPVVSASTGSELSLPTPQPKTADDPPPAGRRPSSERAAALRYQPLRFHAKGGLGEVFLAEDAELHRQVALKRVQAERAGDPENHRRFLLEAEITSKLEHPGVVPVYGLGQDQDGQPCYAMRFIQGETLQDAIKRFHGAEPKPESDAGERRLEFRGLLNRVVAVCNTVAYAHSRGVLHRDLKPSNIMLGKYGETLVLDWGLAKLFDRSAEDRAGGEDTLAPSPDTADSGTQMGQALGTPAYMSPEQATGQWDRVGPASDVYSLGATLYMVLTGKPPFRGKQELDKIREGAFAPPRQVNKDLPRPLEAICLKAMARRPEDRYGSARLLADDLEHWLADEPVSACREPLVARLARWGRRHRAWLAGAAALLLTAVAALAVGLVVVEGERRRTAQERDDKEQARTDEAQARATTMEALRSLTDDVVEQQLSRGVKLGEADKAFVRKVLEHYQTFAALQGDGPESRAIRAEGFHRVGYLRHRLGELPDAEAAFDEAVALRKQLVADFPAVAPYRRDLALSYTLLGNLLRDTGRPEKAEMAYREALALGKQLVADFPEVPQYRLDLALSHNGLGILLMLTGRPEKAETAYRETLALRKQLADDFPAVPEYRNSLANIHHNLGILLKNTGRPREAEAALRDCLTLRKQLAADSPNMPDYRLGQANAQGALGLLLDFTGRPKEAEEAFGEAIAMHKQLAAEFPTVPEYRDELARDLANLGLLLKATSRPREAEDVFREAVTLFGRLADDFPTVQDYRMNLAKGHNNLGLILSETGRPEKAELAYGEALALWKRLAADFPGMPQHRREMATTHLNLGLLLSKTGRPQEAEAAYGEALALQKPLAAEFPAVPEYRRELATSHRGLGMLLAATGRPLKAEAAIGEALALQKRLAADFPAVPDFQNDVAGTLGYLASLAVARRHWPQARALLEEALPYHQRALKANPKQPRYRVWFRANRSTLASILVRLGEHAAAAATVEELARFGDKSADDTYKASCYLSLCVPLAEKDAKLPPPQRKAMADAYAARAVQLLREAVAQGFKDVAQMKKDTDLDPLRARPDFQELLTELEQKAPK